MDQNSAAIGNSLTKSHNSHNTHTETVILLENCVIWFE